MFRCALNAASEKTITVDYATADGSATATNDYVSSTGTLTFNPGDTSKTISVTIVQDVIDELDETFSIGLSNPTNSAISAATGTVTITDDEGTPTLSIADVATSDETAANLTATITLSGDSSQTVTVDWATADSTATAGNDYTTAGGTVTFNPGETSKTVDVTILADTVDEENETFTGSDFHQGECKAVQGNSSFGAPLLLAMYSHGAVKRNAQEKHRL